MAFFRVPAACFNNDVCSICNEDFSDKERIVIAHKEDPNTITDPHHLECLQKWVEIDSWIKDATSHCPLCPFRITSINGKPLSNADPQDESAMDIVDYEVLESFVQGNEIASDPPTSPDSGGDEQIQERNLAILDSVMRWDMNTLASILGNDGPIDLDARGEAVQYASQIPHAGIVELLLKNGPISQEHHDISLCWAARMANPSIVQSLLALSMPLTSEVCGKAIEQAAISGCWEIMGLLLLKNVPISQEHFDIAAMAAAKYNRSTTLQILLGNTTVPMTGRGSISIGARSTAVYYAAENGHLGNVVALLANNAEISFREREEAVIVAVRNRQYEILDLLLGSGPITDEYRGMALCIAAEKGDIRMADALLKQLVSLPYLGAAVKIATENSKNNMLKFLLQKDRIPEGYLGVSVKIAAEDGESEFVISLLQNGPITKQDQDIALQFARQYHDNEMEEALLNCAVINHSA